MSDLNLFKRRLNLSGLLHLDTPLRIASGLVDELSGADIAVIKDANHRPIIPGSSFKGALRAHIERLIRVVEDNTPAGGHGACNPLNKDQWCLTSDRIDELRDEYQNNPAGLDQAIYRASCRVCRVFGSPWLASRVWVKDLCLADPDLWFDRLYQVRHGVGIDRDSETAAHNVLYDFEIVPAGTLFSWHIVIENAASDHSQDGMVIWGLREFASQRVPLGGGRSRGLGWVKLSFDEFGEEVDGENRRALLDYLVSGAGHQIDRSALLARAADFARHLIPEEA